MWQDH